MNSLGTWIFLLFAAGQLDSIHGNKANANTVLNYINAKRKMHGCPPLILSDDLSKKCARYAVGLSFMKNATNSKPIETIYTENICKFGIGADGLRLCVEKWYDGVRYDMMDAQANEFTAMIWRSSKYMGYGEAILGSTGAVVVVRFVPAGHVIGQYTYNVPPVIKKYSSYWRSLEQDHKHKTSAGHQAYQAPLIMLTILTISYWFDLFLN